MGTTAQRDAAPSTGFIRWNTTLEQAEIYSGSTWGSVGGGATGGGPDAVFQLNSPSMTTSYSIPSGKNAMLVGPLGIPTGITLTVPTGSRLVVL